MIRKAPPFKAYWFIRKNRFRKKRKIMKMALRVMIDKTIAAYLLIVCGYVFVSFFIAADYIHEFDDTFIAIEEGMEKGFWLLVTALPIRYIFNSFREPGILFSSAEYQLTMLPFSRRRIWLYAVVEKVIKQAIIYTIIGMIIILAIPISSGLIILYIGLLLLYDIFMIIPQWKLFQARFFTKMLWLISVIIVNGISALLNSPTIGLTLAVFIVGTNISLLSTLFAHVKWDKVTEISDFRIWKMPLIESASGVKMKQQKKIGIFTNSNKRKKPFNYKEAAIHNRLWMIYFVKNFELVFRSVGAFFLLLTVLAFINPLIFHIGLAFAIYGYSAIATGFFADRMRADIVEVLPWGLEAYRKTFFKWVTYGCAPLLIPIVIFIGIHPSFLALIQLAFYCCVFLYMYHAKMERVLEVLAKKSCKPKIDSSVGFIFLIVLVFSNKYPLLVLSVFILLLLMWKQNKN